jgi:hypothetical protein
VAVAGAKARKGLVLANRILCDSSCLSMAASLKIARHA